MKKDKSLIHLIAKCEECNWESGNYLVGSDAAYAHARKKKHLVMMEMGYSVIIDGRLQEKP